MESGAIAAAFPAAADLRAPERIKVTVTSRLCEVETSWRQLAAVGLESPGQDFDFIRLWIDTFNVPENDQVFIVGYAEGAPVALLPLMRRSAYGLRLLTWFPGRHVGCNAPLVDREALSRMSHDERCRFWTGMTGGIKDVDAIYLGDVPDWPEGMCDELGASIPADTLYRAEFKSWRDADATQRTRSRRKHDRQQGDRLDALGNVGFEELRNGDDTREVLATMFRQRAARFVQMGVPDPFESPQVRGFYSRALKEGSGIDVRLHVLRLDGRIVAVRYNVVRGARMFCLISSMSDDPQIQAGSPGKQCLLRVMQNVFDRGVSSFDMGAGFTDEKRHWCNQRIPVRHHYIPITLKGRIGASAHRRLKSLRHRIKSNPRLLEIARRVRMAFGLGKTPVGRPGDD